MAEVKAKQKLFVDNERVRVQEWRFARGAQVGHHRHQYDYVVVPIMSGKLRAVDSTGEHINDLKLGVPYFRKAGVEHNVFNATDGEFAFIEVEIK